MLHIKNAKIFDGESFRKEKNIIISEGKIVSIGSDKKILQSLDVKGCIVAPGFIDIQVNGGGGVFFNDSPTLQSITRIMGAHLQYGTTSLLPTLITDTETKTRQALKAMRECLVQKIPGILGMHLEGPAINAVKKGIHPKNAIRNFSANEVKMLCSQHLGLTLITLAPEEVEIGLIKKLTNNNIVFAGHTNATYKQMAEFFSRGIKGVTHLFNACSQFESREAGVVGAALYHDDIWCGLIVDGFHVSYDTIRVALRTKKSSKFILVSDAMSPVGTKLKSFFIGKEKISVKGGKCFNADGTLAGSAITVYDAFKNLLQNKLVSLPEALKMSSTNAAECLGIDKENKYGFKKGRILPGYDADLVVLNEKSLKLEYVIQNSRIMEYVKS